MGGGGRRVDGDPRGLVAGRADASRASTRGNSGVWVWGSARARVCQPVIIGRLPRVSGFRVGLVEGWRWARSRSLAIVSGRGEELAEGGRGLGVTVTSMRTRSPASSGQGLHRPALALHRVGVRPPLGHGEDRRQLGVAQRADAVPLEFGATR